MNKKIITLASCILLFHSGCMFSKKNTNKGSTMLETGTKLNLSEFTKLDNGILYNVITAGSGTKPTRGTTITVHYTGWLLKNNDTLGTKFDSSVDRGQKFKFPVGLGYVIPGWDKMLADMLPGEKRIIILPANMAYGAQGAGAAIPPNATLVFEVELF
jgi:FKBP-type peptidyl-prolyl cis-trans isomerase